MDRKDVLTCICGALQLFIRRYSKDLKIRIVVRKVLRKQFYQGVDRININYNMHEHCIKKLIEVVLVVALKNQNSKGLKEYYKPTLVFFS